VFVTFKVFGVCSINYLQGECEAERVIGPKCGQVINVVLSNVKAALRSDKNTFHILPFLPTSGLNIGPLPPSTSHSPGR